MPLVTTGIALGVGTAVIGLLSHPIAMASFSSQLSLLIGLGVGVDYALFIVTRMRQGIQRGRTVPDAIVDSLDTSGRAVMFAGITVCIALLGMFALGVSFLYGVAIAASITVAFTVLAALTLLPALLGFVKLRVLPRRQRKALSAGGAGRQVLGGFWVRWSAAINRRPAIFATVAGAPHAGDRDPVPLDADRLVRRRERPGRTRRPARHTTCWRRASVPATTGRSC